MRSNPRRQCRDADPEYARPPPSRPALACVATGDVNGVTPPIPETSSGAVIVGSPLPATPSTTPTRRLAWRMRR
ncbi:hypothetical protein RR46_07286 [Papilio xuthus]|uniref:Uncharacterized protein n=1 Tax=Papilio xuthus TaxID=66420 RepID=A0A194PXQ5_PAPXU|nr:hypothetical protein RR46_07286 [Papilio xuthus]